MDGTTILIIAIPVLVILGAVTLVASARRRDQGAATGRLSGETLKRDRARQRRLPPPPVEGDTRSGREVERAVVAARAGGDLQVRPDDAPVPWTPPDPDEIGVNRRQFFNRSITLMMVGSLSSFGAACIAFLWPGEAEGFGAVIRAGRLEDLRKTFADTKAPVYNPEGRFYLNPYPVDTVDKAEASGAYAEPVLNGMREGVVALFQKCPHLGCRVPWCQSSQWFECPCHGSQYNRVGQKKGGPAPRGMDVMGVAVTNGVVEVDTGSIFPGAPIGTNTTGQTAEGAHCLGAGGHG